MDKRVKEILFERRSGAELRADNFLRKAMADAEFKACYNAEKTTLIAQAKAKAFGETYDEKELMQKQQATNTALQKLGLTRADITPNYVCKKCNDTGVVNNQTCQCVQKLEAKLSMQADNLKRLKTFEDSDLSIFDDSEIPKLYALLQKWVQMPTPEKKFVVLAGATGTGKTFLLECLASACVKRGDFVVVKTAFELVSDCLKFHTTFDSSKPAILDKYFNCDALFIDDLGSEPIYKNVSLEYLYLILEKRAKDGKRTVISTNLNAGDIRDTYGERCFSRIFNKQISIPFFFKNKDLRI